MWYNVYAIRLYITYGIVVAYMDERGLMNKKAATSINVDAKVKKEATEVFEALGLTFTSGIDIYLRTVARERRIPFEIDLNRDVRGAKNDS